MATYPRIKLVMAQTYLDGDMMLDPITKLPLDLMWKKQYIADKANWVKTQMFHSGLYPNNTLIPFACRKSQNCYLILLDEDKGCHLVQTFHQRKYWKVLQELFPHGVFFPEQLKTKDRQHIYTRHGKARCFVVLDLDFMPGVTLKDVYASMVLHFDSIAMPATFDTSKIPEDWICEDLPVTIEEYKFMKFDDMHVEFKAFHTSKLPRVRRDTLERLEITETLTKIKKWREWERESVASQWTRETSRKWLKHHESADIFDPTRETVSFNQIDWNPKAEVEEEDPVSPSTFTFDFGLATSQKGKGRMIAESNETSRNSRSYIDLTASSRESSPEWSPPSPSTYKKEKNRMIEEPDLPQMQIERSYIDLTTPSPESSSPTIYTPAASSSPASTPGSGKKRLRGGKYKAGSSDAWGDDGSGRRDRVADDEMMPRRVLRPRNAKKKA